MAVAPSMHRKGLRGYHSGIKIRTWPLAMTPEQWQRVRALFEAAIEHPEAERAAWVEAACAGAEAPEREIRAEVMAMLAADAASAGVADALAGEIPDLLGELEADAGAAERASLVGARVGPWQLVREIGRGGMGTVYFAERVQGGFEQHAAVKLVRAGWDAGDMQRRFRDERRILAGLEHAGIARLIDGGETPDGKPYLAMEYIDGQPLCAHCDARRLPVAERLRLFLSVCAAVAHAHRNLIVHRDIKPSNLLVTRDGEVKLLDFGIARLLDVDALATGTGLRLFTPEYAAPEQVRGDPVTTSADVYALGLVLFELLTGERPYGRAAATPMARERAVLTDEPSRPSQLAQSRSPESRNLAKARQSEPRQLGASLRGDLDAIVLKALRKEPQQRYASVEALADDVRRHLEHRPVLARRGSWRYQSTRFVRRHWFATSMAAIALAGLLGGLGLAVWQADKARQQQAHAEAEAAKAQAVAQFMTDVFKAADPTTTDGRDPRASVLLAKAVSRIDTRADLDPAQRAGLLYAMGRAYISLQDPVHALTLFRSAYQRALEAKDVSMQVESRIEIAAALNNDRQEARALPVLEQVQRALAAHPELAARLRERFDYVMALVLSGLDRSAEALRYLDRVYQAKLATHGPGSAEVGYYIEFYAALLTDLERKHEVLEQTQLNYLAAKRNPGLALSWQANFASAYGFALLAAGRPAEAETAYRECLAIQERMFGAGHPGTVSAINNVGTALFRQGRHVEAAGLYERALGIRRAHEAADSLNIAGALARIGKNWSRAGQSSRAIAAYREGLAIYERRRQTGGESSSELRLRAGYARELEATGDHAEALDVLAPVMVDAERADGSFTGAAGVGVRLLEARLLARSASKREDCSCANQALQLAGHDSPEAREAAILAADCERRHGQTARANRHLALIPSSDAALAGISDYARSRLAVLRGAR